MGKHVVVNCTPYTILGQLISIVLILSSCHSTKNEETQNLNTYIADRVWVSEDKQQYYYQSNDNTEYVWMTFDRREDGTYSPFSNAQGTPDSNPLSPNVNASYTEGWSALNYFKVDGNKLITQDEDDLDATDLSTNEVEIGNDTTIGVLKYNTLIVKYHYGNRTLKSKKSI